MSNKPGKPMSPERKYNATKKLDEEIRMRKIATKQQEQYLSVATWETNLGVKDVAAQQRWRLATWCLCGRRGPVEEALKVAVRQRRAKGLLDERPHPQQRPPLDDRQVLEHLGHRPAIGGRLHRPQ
jgi:hypothetical protein